MKRVESANQLAMKVASDDEDDAVDELLEHQHQIMRSSSAYSLVSIDGGQVSAGISLLIATRYRISLPYVVVIFHLLRLLRYY